MSIVRRDGVEFEVTLRRSGTVRLRHRGDGVRWVDHGEVCRWIPWKRPRNSRTRIMFAYLYDGIFLPLKPADGDLPCAMALPPRLFAPSYVVDRWLALETA